MSDDDNSLKPALISVNVSEDFDISLVVMIAGEKRTEVRISITAAEQLSIALMGAAKQLVEEGIRP